MKKYRIAHIFCGIGGKGLGAANALARFDGVEATFETIGGIDFDPLACKDFEMLVGAPTLCADVHKLEPGDLIKFFGPIAPDVVMMSPPCKGFSGLLSAKRALEPHYQLMNTLMERALFLACATWTPPPKLIFVENVPRIASRGKAMTRRCIAMGEAYGYAVAEGNHDCGELGGLAQHRRRYFQLWRHRPQVPQFVYQPAKLRVRACGEVLGPLPMPGDIEAGGPMHSVPNLSWRNWVRLGMIPAGGDWRNLPGVLGEGEPRREKFRRAPVASWDAAAQTVTGPGGSAAAAVADPRFGHVDRVTPWADAVGTITRSPAPSSGAGAVADPRFTVPPNEARHWNKYAVNEWTAPAQTVIGAIQPGSGAPSIADERFKLSCDCDHSATDHGFADECRLCSCASYRAKPLRNDDLGVLGWADPSVTVSGQSRPRNGRFVVADPRFSDGKKKNWQQVAGVTAWTEPAPTVISGAKIHAGAFQVADPRFPNGSRYRIMTLSEALDLDLPLDRPPPFIPIIIAEDGTWHRPLTTLELAVLQSIPWLRGGVPLVLAGKAHTRWREAIGNAVPPAAALAIAEQLLLALLIATLGAFALNNNEIWVAPDARVA